MQVDWNQSIDMQESVVGWLKKQLCKGGKIKKTVPSRGGPEKHPAHTLNRNLTASPWKSVGENGRLEPRPPASDAFFCFRLTWFHLFYRLFPLNLPPSFCISLSLWLLFLFLPLSRLLLKHTRTKQVQGTQVWRLCKQLLPGADQMFLLWQTPHCISTFQYIINPLFHSNCFEKSGLKAWFEHLIHLLFMSYDTAASKISWQG